jgi:gamma-glutamylaminecyclotransferase
MNGRMEQLVFVYGTLKKGFSNHRLLASSELLGRARTVKKYAMYSTGLPIVVKEEAASTIFGELYRVDEVTLVYLDSLEGHPDWYRREEVEVLVDDKGGGQHLEKAWIYFSLDKRGTLVPSGEYLKKWAEVSW